MRKMLVSALAIGLFMATASVASAGSLLAASPVEELDTDPVGHLGWLPADANEAGDVGSGERRLVVTFFEEQAGKGVFGLKFQAVGAPVQVVEHPAFISSVDDLSGQDAIDPADQAFGGVAGDVRLGDCALIGDATFHYAYSTAHTEPVGYTAGACDVVTPIDDTTVSVTTYVPGFWVDVTENGPYTELFYGTLYDQDGTGDEWYQEADDLSFSASVTQ
jgi:hypothetical protein